MKKKYRVPDSVEVLQVVAWVLVGLGALLVVLGIAGLDELGGRIVIFPGIGVLLCGLLYFVFAGIREAGERTAYYAQHAAELLEKMDMERTAEKAGTSMSFAMQTPPPLSGNASGPEKLKPAARRFFVEKPGGEQQGPLDIADLQRLLNAGVIVAETPVFREGDEEWRKLGDFIAG